MSCHPDVDNHDESDIRHSLAHGACLRAQKESSHAHSCNRLEEFFQASIFARNLWLWRSVVLLNLRLLTGEVSFSFIHSEIAVSS